MRAESPFDVCVIGHVTRDMAAGKTRGRPGGAAYYGAAALARLGLRARLVTRLAAEDDDLLSELRELGVALTVKSSAATTVFEVKAEEDGHRSYRALSVADAFLPDDLSEIQARAVLMDPLAPFDGFAALMEKAASAAPDIALDAQGFVRKFILSRAPAGALRSGLEGFRFVTTVKADLAEAGLLTGQSKPEAAARALSALGPREVIVTMGPEGSLVYAEGEASAIPAFAPAKLVDPTGAGDSYLAGYVASRLAGEGPRAAARFGAAVAALKLERAGAFAGSKAAVAAFLSRQPC